MTQTLRVTLGQHSRGGVHGVNQDFHGAMLPHEPLRSRKGIAVALADGIGSSPVSQEASAAAVRSFLEDYYATSDAWSVRRSAQRVLGATNAWLHAQTMRSHARFDKDRGYVCTFSALVVKGREVHVLHVGDARIYRLQGTAWEQITEDHRVHLSSVESYLGRALGTGPHIEIDYRCLEAEAGDLYLLATDGAYTHLDAASVHSAVQQFPDDLDAAAQALVDIAQARGSEDDITVQLLRIDGLPQAQPLLGLRQELALPPVLTERMSFEGFRVVRELHVSDRSHVHLAVDEQTGQPLVLKLPSVALRDDTAYLERFVLEEWVAQRLHNPHVLRPYATQRPRTHLYVAMEYIEGQTLARWMMDHPAPDLDSVRSLAAQVAKGLQAFHSKEMLHQDLRPENIMIDRSGTAKIIDFGATHVAGLTEGLTDSRQPPAIEGTLQYTAPEYFTGQGSSARSDLFSLAVLVYQMLTGQLPYGLQVTRLRSPADTRKLRYVPVRHLRPDLPDWLDVVLQKALHPDPAKRQEAVSEFMHDLHFPSHGLQHRRAVPLIERNPVVFWQTTTAVLALAVLWLTARLVLAA